VMLREKTHTQAVVDETIAIVELQVSAESLDKS
jgi:hypothetical protein